MKQTLCLLFWLLAVWTGTGRLLGQQITALEYVQSATIYNLQAIGGVPISMVAGVPPGSSGKLPATNSLGFISPVTTNQFESMVSFGGLSAPTNWTILNSNAVYLSGTNGFSGSVAQAMGLPIGQSNGIAVMVFQKAQIGAPYVSSPVSYDFGSIIPTPSTDINGNVLTNNASGYWQTVPWSASNHDNDPYYYSPNAGVVFATQAGQVPVTWITAGSYTDVSHLTYANPGGAAYPSFYTNGAYIYLLYTETYVVSGIPVKSPQKMFWTEGSFQNLGYPVTVANGHVFAVHVVYNTTFPTNVVTPYQDPNVEPQTNPTNTLQEFRTLWFDPTENQIRAYNAVGTVFVELLGPPISGANANQYLGFEIVDVQQDPSPENVTIDLGDSMTPYQDGFEGHNLTPYPINNNLGTQYYYDQMVSGSNAYYADRLTTDANDMQMYWLTTSIGGLQWPDLFVDYNLVWPPDPAQYSHYVRPLVDTADEAASTGVQLDGAESPSLDYQDPLDQPRGFLTSSNTYYTWLSLAEPAHRGLLRFNAGNNVRFERVFSCLGQGLQDNALLAGSVATNLSAWNSTNNTFTNFASGFNPPYVTNLKAYVGDNLTDPPGEIGSTNGLYGDYWAGYINTNCSTSFLVAALNTNLGNSYNPSAYIDPFANGFATANQGAIIPVNAIPGHNLLEVWWFRQNTADPTLGFQPVYWPSIVADYTIGWPVGAPQVVMASNAGSGALPDPEASGAIYTQPDPTQPGFNPNEEHALTLAGTVYALRDDLNQTNVNPASSLPFGGYTSAAFALLAYTNIDGRPAMAVFQIRREAPEAGILFDYVVTAGSLLQAPMPLPLMDLPTWPNTNYPTLVTNFDIEPPVTGGDLPAGWNVAAAQGPFASYQSFTFQDRNNDFWVYRGLHEGLPPLAAGDYNTNTGAFGPLPPATAVVNQPFSTFIHLSRLLPSLTIGAENLPTGLMVVEDITNGLSIGGTPTTTGSSAVTITITDTDGSSVTMPLALTVVSSGTNVALGPLAITSTNQYSHAVVTYNRPPALAAPPTPTNSFTMRFYYKTQAGFDWPNNPNPPLLDPLCRICWRGTMAWPLGTGPAATRRAWT